jgi:hypothetical protein
MRPDAWHWVTANPSIQSALEAVSSYGGVLQVAGRTGVKTADDLRQIPLVIGSWGVETSSYTMPVLLNALAGTKFKVVTG